MQKVQVIDLKFVRNPESMIEEYQQIGFITKVVGTDLELYWGKPKKVKPKDETPEKKSERRSKTERRLGRKFDGNK